MSSNNVFNDDPSRFTIARYLSDQFSMKKNTTAGKNLHRSSISFIDNNRRQSDRSKVSRHSLQAGSVSDITTTLNDNDDELSDSLSIADNYRFAPQSIRNRRQNTRHSLGSHQRSTTSTKHHFLALPVTETRPTEVTIQGPSQEILHGQTLLHLAARLGHEDILRLLITETSAAHTLLDTHGETPLLTAIKSGSTSAAIVLMEYDPRSIIISDFNRSSVFHYACEHSNDIVLNRVIALLRRLNSSTDRIKGLTRLMERNFFGKTPFDIAIEHGQLKCIKQFFLSSWLLNNININELMNGNSLKKAIDKNQLDILSFFVHDINRFDHLIHLFIDTDGQSMNLLEYSIYREKKNIIRLFLSVEIPREDDQLLRKYKSFLQHYNKSNSSPFYQTPIQKLLIHHEYVSLVPLLLEKFIDNNGIDLSIIDDCLYNKLDRDHCIFGQGTSFSKSQWLQQHPLNLIAEADSKFVYDHPLVRMCVDLKFHLFGNICFFSIFFFQCIYVALYTGIALGSPTPADQQTNYYEMYNYSCIDLCLTLTNNLNDPAKDQASIRALRFLLLIISFLAILKEFYQIIVQRDDYLRRLYINMIELHMYVSAIIYSLDVNECTRQTGIRCSTQWMVGGIGLLSVWTSLLLFLMNGIEFGRYVLLFITVFKTFLKFIAVYIFIWIGYILAFHMICKDILNQFRSFNFVPKLLVMLIGEYDVDGTFFLNNNQLMPGAEGALILYSAYIFTFFIVMTNIMGGLAVADVKLFLLNAQREHLRSRIGVILSFQAYLGTICETISSINIKLSKNKRWMRFLKKSHLISMKYQLKNLEIRPHAFTVPHQHSTHTNAAFIPDSPLSSATNIIDHINTHTGFYTNRRLIENYSLPDDHENVQLRKKTEEIKDILEESNIRINQDLRKIALNLQNELEDIKRRLNS